MTTVCRLGRDALAVLLCALLCGCVGAGAGVVAEGDLAGPVSLSGTVFDEAGRPLRIGAGLEKVADFEVSRRSWALLRVVPLGGGEWDVTEEVNAALADHGADAVVDLEIEAELAPYAAVVALFLIVPTYTKVTLRGSLVRRVASGPEGEALPATQHAVRRSD